MTSLADIELDTTSPPRAGRASGRQGAAGGDRRDRTGPQLLDYIAGLADRAERVHGRAVRPDEDNMLAISSDGRAAALDLRLVQDSSRAGGQDRVDLPGVDLPGVGAGIGSGVGSAGAGPGPAVDGGVPVKLEVGADRIAAIWSEHAGDRLLGADSEPHPTPGALQLVFCDLGTPKPDRWNAYDELRALLVARGLPRAGVRFVHEAGTDEAKGQLFAACRSGQVAALIGSTERMGVGTNVQARAVALHHLDCPWRPADLAQREGRIIRQGNQNPEVQVIRYVVERSFDSYSWQTVARKARFIAQVMRGRLDVREIDDIGDATLSYSEVKALAAGNPLLLDHAEATAELTRLDRLDRMHDRAQRRLGETIRSGKVNEGRLGQQVQLLDRLLQVRRSTRGDAFTMTVAGSAFSERPAAGARLHATLTAEAARFRGQAHTLENVAELGGVPIHASMWQTGFSSDEVHLELTVAGVRETGFQLSPAGLASTSPGGLVSRLEHQVQRLDRVRDDTGAALGRVGSETARAREQKGRPFPHRDELTAARERVADLDAVLQAQAAPAPPRDASTGADDGGGGDASAEVTASSPGQGQMWPLSRGCRHRSRLAAHSVTWVTRPARLARLARSTRPRPLGRNVPLNPNPNRRRRRGLPSAVGRISHRASRDSDEFLPDSVLPSG